MPLTSPSPWFRFFLFFYLVLSLPAAQGKKLLPPSQSTPQLTLQLSGASQANVRVVRLSDNAVLFNRTVQHNKTLTLPTASSYRLEASCSNGLKLFSRTVTDPALFSGRLTQTLRYARGVLTNQPVTTTPDPRYIRAVGNTLKNRNGTTIRLRGVNLGGWLVPENWMNGFASVNDDIWMRFAREKLEKRFGETKATRLMKLWEDHWITARDLDQIKAIGFNTLRVPFGWRNLQKADGSWRRNGCGEIDFSRFDWIVAEAQKRGMYVIFDLHNWQSWKPMATKGLTTASEQLLFNADLETARIARTQASALWSALAKHFKGNGTVAGFDVVNEPTGSYEYIAHQPFYKAIRDQDAERLVIMEWIDAADLFNSKHPANAWSNIMLSDHHYMYKNTTEKKDQAALDKRIVDERITAVAAKYPYYVGEVKDSDQTYTSFTTTNNSAEWLARAMDAKGWHWTVWTYKTATAGGWGLYQYGTNLQINLETDSIATIEDRWANRLVDWQKTSGAVIYPLDKRTLQFDGYTKALKSP